MCQAPYCERNRKRAVVVINAALEDDGIPSHIRDKLANIRDWIVIKGHITARMIGAIGFDAQLRCEVCGRRPAVHVVSLHGYCRKHRDAAKRYRQSTSTAYHEEKGRYWDEIVKEQDAKR